ncbi:NAD-dependent epimerase/dehydratase family protein [Synechococcus sp. ROS8604]|uniref:NAD-dependent epimerase/dehydratase family protein n=1 Tax=Synechococcus sp. ROS8604 TaxID=1442557 RepID=UPI00164822A5|nr:NAD-dependent epimerase/dehydratase family protein [Synechococcus sp. ROS8604]QNI88463.1 putative NAD-dependent epimerase/dehydratase [Synechococcus sp. ROS8604]
MSTYSVIGCGYVGSFLAASMKNQGHYVVGTTRTPQRFAELRNVVNEPIALDLAQQDCDFSFLEDQEGVLISVAPTQNGEGYQSVFSNGIRNLARAIRCRQSTRPLHVTYISSAGVYGDHQGQTVTEDSTVDCLNPVNAMLVEAENVLLTIDRPDTKICVLRLGGIYGPGRDMVAMIKQAAGEQIPKNGSDIPAWSGIFDITNGVSLAFSKKLVGIYNLVDDMQLSRRELSNEICDIDGLPPVIWANENTPGARAMNAKVANEKIKSEGFLLSSPSMLMPTPV